jgi:hypothetical protein
VRVDQDGRDARASQHRRRGRAGETAADDGYIRIPHALAFDPWPYHCAAKGKETLKATV